MTNISEVIENLLEIMNDIIDEIDLSGSIKTGLISVHKDGIKSFARIIEIGINHKTGGVITKFSDFQNIPKREERIKILKYISDSKARIENLDISNIRISENDHQIGIELILESEVPPSEIEFHSFLSQESPKIEFKNKLIDIKNGYYVTSVGGHGKMEIPIDKDLTDSNHSDIFIEKSLLHIPTLVIVNEKNILERYLICKIENNVAKVDSSYISMKF